MTRARELLRSVKNLAILRELSKTNGGLDGIGDLIDNFIDSEAKKICLERFKALPGGAEMVEQRYHPSSRTSRCSRNYRRELWARHTHG